MVLPAPFTPTTKTTHGGAEKGAAPAGRSSARRISSREEPAHGGERRPRRSRRCARAAPPCASSTAGKPQVGGEERLLDGLERGRVEGAPPADEVLDRGVEDLARAGEPAAEAIERGPHSELLVEAVAGVLAVAGGDGREDAGGPSETTR